MIRPLILAVLIIIMSSAAVGCAPTQAIRPLTGVHVRTIERCAQQNQAIWSAFRESMSRLAKIESIARTRHLQQRIILRYGHDDPAAVLTALRDAAAQVQQQRASLPEGSWQQLLLDHPIAGDIAFGSITEAEAARICHKVWLHADEGDWEALADLLQPFSVMQHWAADVSAINKALDEMQDAAIKHLELARRESQLIHALAHAEHDDAPELLIDATVAEPAFREVFLSAIDDEPTRDRVAAVLDALLAQR